MLKVGCLLFPIVAMSAIIWLNHESAIHQEQETAKPTCSTEYLRCRDNEDIVINHKSKSGLYLASECKATANVVARYGEAELPFLAFQSYYLGDFFKKTGVAVLLEKGAMFQNGFGARQHVTLICRYDLKTDIATVEIIPK